MTEPTPRTTRRAGNGARADQSPDERLAEMEARLERLERAPGLRERGRGVMARVVPPEANRHFRNAGREQLLGVRSIVDFWIQRLDEADARAGRRGRRETIEIE